ncbi:unnamed protein product [Rotaria sp. Silwood2]|nr:unnamed protein product [Rotaria sp. Silwood2]CAF4055248.1 unnamed protein product [Rotaria sp. Silwood2]
MIMDKHYLTNANANANNNNIHMINEKNFRRSLPIIVSISNDQSHTNETDRFFNEYDSSNILTNLPDLCDLEERDENTLPFPGFVEKAFYCLGQTTPPRYQCLKLITWSWFERISMFVILINCITVGIYEPCARHTGIESSKKCDTALCFWLQTTDYFVFALFTVEMCIKMTAMGIFGKGTYLAESWNRLDFFIVLTGLVELLIPGDNLSLSAIRTVRVLRPLRVINRVPSMRILVMLLLDTLPMLGNVLLLCFFIFFIFGVIGVQLWKGLLRNRCFLQLNTTIIDNYALLDDFPFQSFYIPSDQDSFICSDPSSSGMTKCSEIPQLRRDNMICNLDFHSLSSSLANKTINGCINWNQYYQLCAISDKNPFSGMISFDNIGLAWLAVFQIITFENWVSIMYYIQDAHSFWDWIYFVCLTVIGSFFMMNLCLVVISTQFSVTKKRETARMLAEQKRFSRSTTTVTSDQQGSCWEETIKYFQRLWKRAYKRFRTFWKNHRQKSNKFNKRHHRKAKTRKKVVISNALPSSNVNIVSSAPFINQKHRPNCRHNQSQSLLVPTPLSKSIDRDTDTCEICSDVIAPMPANNNLSIGKDRRNNENLEFERQEQQIERNDICDCDYQDEIVHISDNNLEEEKSKFRQRCEICCCCCCCCSCFRIIQKLISLVVTSKYFDHFIFLAIIMNTLSMSIEYHGQPQSLTNVLEYSNYVFIILFTIEMLFKIIAEGCLKYIKNLFNIFDGGVVLISLIELYEAKHSGLSVLRTFRLLRVLKLIRFMPTLRRQLILTQEDWNEVLYNGMKKTSPWSALYFIALMIFNNYILLNLLVAILVESFPSAKEDGRTNSKNSTNRLDKADQFKTQTIITGNIQMPENLDESTSIYQTIRRQEKNDRHTDPNTSSAIQLAIDTQLLVIRSCLSELGGQRIFECIKKRENYSLHLFSPSNRLRKVFQRLIVQKSFDYFILFFIALNCITLAMERPSISPTSFERQFLNYANYIFTAVFTIEMIIKVIASGLIFGSNTYLHTGWNVMDGFLVIVSVVDLCTMNQGRITSLTESDTTLHILGMLRVFRLLRTLRALTIINRAPGLKLVVQTLLSSLRPIGHIFLICCIFFIIFGILGIQLFKGKFYYCEGPLAHNIRTRQECEAMSDHRWQNRQYNFDHLGQALLTLFVLSSKDGWVQIMYNGIDAVDVEMQPIKNYSEAKLIYFVSFILIVSFFVLNMFVGVIVKNFRNCQAQQELEEEARNNKVKHAKKIKCKQHLMRELSYYAHFSSWRKRLHDICISKYFDLIIAAIIGFNVVTMSLEFYSMPSDLDKFLEYCNYVFTGVFSLEFIWKIIALGPSRYFKDKWNQMDSSIVFLSIADIIMEKISSGHILPINPTLIRVIRVLRIVRVLKLLKMAKGVRTLLDTVLQALPQVGNLSLLFILLFFIFATLAVELFGKLECSEEQPCSGLNKHAHFKNFGIALLTLFRIATSDNWNSIMKDTLRQDESPNAINNNFLKIISPIYFVVFILMAQFVLINIVVAVLMKNLEDSNKMMVDDAEMDEELEGRLEPDVHDGNYVEEALL